MRSALRPAPWTAAAIAAAACAAVLAAQAGRAQAPPPPQQTPVFRGGVELVTVDVTVVDKNGRPVPGLTPDDFVVTLEGQPRPVRALDYQVFGGTPDQAPDAAPARETTNAPPAGRAPSRGGRVIVLLVDDLSFKPGSGKELATSAIRMLSSFDANDLIGVATTSGLGPVVNPTRDRAAVKAALTGKPIVGRYDDTSAPFDIFLQEAFEIENDFPRQTLDIVAARECGLLFMPIDSCRPAVAGSARQLAENSIHRAAAQFTAYRAVIDALRAAPAPRVIVALSRGIAATNAHADLQAQLEPITRAAADADVEFYALTEAPDYIDLSLNSGAREQAQREEGQFLTAGIQTVASAAGGEAFVVIGTADRFFKRIQLETSGFYRLGVEAPLMKDARRFLATKVSVRPPGLTVRVRREALRATVAPEAVPIEEQLKTRLAQGGIAYGVPIALATALRRDPAGSQLQLAVNVQVPSAVAGPLVAEYALVNEAGRVMQAARRDVPAVNAGDDYWLAFPVPIAAPGAYRLRFAVADAKGSIGSLERRVRAELTPIGAFLASDLFTTWAGADGTQRFLALETLPDGAETIHASLELYPADASAAVPDVTVRIALAVAGADAPLLERDVTPAVAGATRSISVELPVAQLKAGAYTVRATLLQAGAAVGTVETTITKR